MKNQKVTVVTITYNLLKAGREKTFRQCVESVHKQTYQNIEHIVIDGASNDGTLDLIKEYEDKGWVKCYSEPDKGIYDAMNKGIDKASGEYIAFLNSDDFWHDPRGVEESVKALVENTADFSYAVCNYLGENDRYLGKLSPIIGSFYVRMPFSHQTMFTKRSKMLELGKFDLHYKSAGDYDFVRRLILSGAKGVEVPLNFTSYRMTGFSCTQQYLSAQECERILMTMFKKYGFSEEDGLRCWNQQVKKDFIDKIINDVHPAIKQEVLKILAKCPFKEGYYENNYIPCIINEYAQSLNKTMKYYLLGFIPLFKIKGNEKKKKYYLFHFIPLLKIDNKKGKTKYYLFDFIPLLKIKGKESKRKIYLFNFIPLLKIKKK